MSHPFLTMDADLPREEEFKYFYRDIEISNDE
jgi:hypothetical protein